MKDCTIAILIDFTGKYSIFIFITSLRISKLVLNIIRLVLNSFQDCNREVMSINSKFQKIVGKSFKLLLKKITTDMGFMSKQS
jgi:hypothetical protein